MLLHFGTLARHAKGFALTYNSHYDSFPWQPELQAKRMFSSQACKDIVYGHALGFTTRSSFAQNSIYYSMHWSTCTAEKV